MIYFLYPLCLVGYFEILGRAAQTLFAKKRFIFGFPLGFIVFLAFTYISGWPITAFNLSYSVLLGYYLVVLLLSFVFIAWRFSKIDWHFSLTSWASLLLAIVVLCYFSYHRTLGETHGFDTLYYLNFIRFNIGATSLNTLHPHFGTSPNTYKDTITYVFQSFYYMIPSLLGVAENVGKALSIRFDFLPAYVWGIQILCHFIWVSCCLEVVASFSLRKEIKLLFMILFVLFMGNFYYQQVYGFIGNNFRMAIHAWGTLCLFYYFREKEKSDKYLFYLSLLAVCGLASTGTFSAVFILFGLYFAWVTEEKHILKEYAVVLAIPALNIVISRMGAHVQWILMIAAAMAAVYLLNNPVNKLFAKKSIRVITVIVLSVVMILLSYRETGNLWDFRAFFDNYSEIADMSWDYFMFQDIRHYLFNLFILIPFLVYLVFARKEKFAIAAWVLIIVVYNPFTCTYMNKINWVYYRSYDLWINPYTMVAFFWYCCEKWKMTKIQVRALLAAVVLPLAILQIPFTFHDTFLPQEDYHPIYKIERSELEIIENVKQMIQEKGISHPRIITPTFFMPSFLENATYLYGKEKRYHYDQGDPNSYQLYLIFFPHDDSYDNFYPQGAIADYAHTKEYLAMHQYDILVLDNGLYYQNEKGEHLPVTSLVEEAGYIKSEYSSARYSVYDIRG